MNRLLFFLGLLLVFLFGGCGGSGSSGTTASQGASASTSASGKPQAGAGSTAGGAVPGSAGRPTSTTAASSTSGAPSTANGGSINVRVPATFTIRPGGRLDPSTVSSPAFLAVRLTIVAADGRAHKILLKAPQPHALSVPAGGRASVLIAGMRAGRYPLLVDGSPRGALLIGGEPGP